MTTVSFTRRDLVTPMNNSNMKFIVQRYSHSAIGGPKEAVITAYGSESDLWQLMNFIRYGVEIQDNDADEVWWGYISSIELRVGWVRVGITIDDMANDISVMYTYYGTQQVFPNQQNNNSRFEYGTKEDVLSVGDAGIDQATAYANSELEQRKYPVTEIAFESQGEGGFSATLFCRGWWDTLDWRYYHNETGLVQLSNIQNTAAQRIAATISSSNIEFQSASTITDYTTCKLGGFNEGDWIYIQGAGDNNGLYLVDNQRGDDEIDINPNYGDGQLASAGSGTTVVITTASKVLERFGQYSGSNWNAHSVHLRLRAVGSPSDFVVVAIHQDTNPTGGLGGSGSPSTETVTGSLTAASVGESMDWVEIPLSASTTLNHNTPYWIAVSRSEGVTASGYYETDVMEGTYYNPYNLDLRVSSCTTRIDRTPDGRMPFRVTGRRETTVQMVDVLQFATNPQAPLRFMPYIDVHTSSSVMTNQYRPRWEKTCKSEMEELLKSGTLNRKRLLAKVTKDMVVKIYEEPESGSNNYRIKSDRRLYGISETEIPLSKCPVGIWLNLSDVIPDTFTPNRVAKPTEMFVEESEYYPETDTYIPRARASRDPWGIDQISEG